MPLILGPLFIGLLPFLAAVVLLGLSKSSSSAHGSSSSGSFWDFITGRVYLHEVGGFAAKFSRWIVSKFSAGQLVMLARYFNSMATLTIHFSRSITHFATALTATVARMEARGDPRARAKATTANSRAVHAGRAASHANTHARSVGHALNAYKARSEPRIRHATHAVDVTLPRDIGRVRTREEALSRDLGKLKERTKSLEDGASETWRWIRSHPLSATTGVFAGAVAVALSHLGLGWLRCKSNPFTNNKRACSLLGDLGALLGLTTAVLAATDLERLAKEMQGVEHGVTAGIADLVGLGKKLGL